MPIHPGEEHPQIGELLPFVARHFCNERTLAMNDFVVTEDEDEMFLKRVKQGKRDIAVMKAPVNRVEAYVMEEIVHPTHVPFETETETAEIRRSRHTRPRG